MKKFLIFSALLHFLLAYSQKEATNWYFGYNAGLTFNSGSPVPLTDSQMFTNEGSSVISDANGNLLFYTDGGTVYNKTHSIMQNGTGLWGSFSSVQSALIVPKPGFSSIYYVFTVMNEGLGGLSYSEVDMQAGGGLGAVTVKNISLLPATTEQLTAVVHKNGSDIWVIAHSFGGDLFHSYLVTPNGVNITPVTTPMGFNIDNGGFTAAIGTIKASPDGSRLVQTNLDFGVQLFDFNTTTGRVSNTITLTEPFGGGRYSAEFSPSGKVLYVSGGLTITQYNLAANNVVNSAIDVFTGTPGALQVAIDGKIYCATANQPFLSVINNPEVIGEGCNAVANAVYLEGMNSFIGLPTFIQSYFYAGINAKNLCLGNPTSFSISPLSPQSITWNFGDGQTSAQLAPDHVYSAPGTYNVTASFVQNGVTKQYEKTITIIEKPKFSLGGPYVSCTGLNKTISVIPENFKIEDAQYQWTYKGTVLPDMTASLQTLGFGIYEVTVVLNSCSSTQSVEVIENTEPMAIVFKEECENNVNTISASLAAGSFDPDTLSYAWTGPDSFTTSDQKIAPQKTGEYKVTLITAEGCTVMGGFIVELLNCTTEPDIPRGISPNNDGSNDRLELTDLKLKKLSIFNRYGLEVYSTLHYTNQWYGQGNNGNELPTGTYYYIAESSLFQKTGWIYVNREK